jgi:hypothetical protein
MIPSSIRAGKILFNFFFPILFCSDFVYDARVVSEKEKNQAKEMIKELKQKILYVSERNNVGSPNVFIPFRESIEKSLPSDKASDMTTALRLYNYMTLLPPVNIDKRPRLVTRSEGDPIPKTCPFATFEDLQESIYLIEYSDGVMPYVLQWYYDVFLELYKTKTEPASKQIVETYLNPLVNQNYIDKTESDLDRRANIYYPAAFTSTTEQQSPKYIKLFENHKTNNSLQQLKVDIIDSTLYPDNEYIISKIHGVLEYSSNIHKITKLENHEGKEITVEELVDQYYKDPGKYFEDKSNASPPSSSGGGTATTTTTFIDISRTSIELAKPLEIKYIKKEGVSDEYCLHARNRGKSQQILVTDVKSIQNEQEQYRKLFDEGESNNFIIFKCNYCNYQTNIEREYERHVVMKHPGKTAYPSEIDLKKEGLN